MSKIDSIYTTISNRQVHIAADAKYIGSVDSYNNQFTQFFAWLLSRSMMVNFDGKTRCINKESYINLIQTLTQSSKISDIHKHSMFRPIAEAAKLPKSNLKMRDVITSEDRRALFTKLAFAISRGDTTKALLMIGKGAELDTAYYDRAPLPLSFSTDTSDLRQDSRYKFTVFNAPPILQAARKGNAVVCQFLKSAQANLSASGQEYTFKREIMSVDKRLEVVEEPRSFPRHPRTKDRDSHDHRPDDDCHREERRPQLRERTVVTTKDSRSNKKTYRLNQADFSLKEV